MKLFTGLVFCSLVLGASGLLSFLGEAARGTWDMLRAYQDMREANYIGADKYSTGPGGAWAAKVISDARENVQRFTDRFSFGGSGRGAEDSRADQAANEWGRSGRDPNHFRPHGLPDKY
uniref:Serum amyloid A protein n=1 Tax=Equus asinus TaxID=9793 RepID=A0A9L0JX50_EQUAS